MFVSWKLPGYFNNPNSPNKPSGPDSPNTPREIDRESERERERHMDETKEGSGELKGLTQPNTFQRCLLSRSV